jgi:ROK family protein
VPSRTGPGSVPGQTDRGSDDTLMIDVVGGLELGGTKSLCTVGAGPGEIRAELSLPTTSPDETIGHVIEFFGAHGPVTALGIVSFGPLDLEPRSQTFGSILTTPKPGWSRTDLAHQTPPRPQRTHRHRHRRQRRRARRASLGRAPALASGALATSRTSVTSPPAARVRPSSTASISTPTSGFPPTIAPASSSSVATSCIPPLAQDRVRLRADGRVLVELKTVWRDGVRRVVGRCVPCAGRLGPCRQRLRRKAGITCSPSTRIPRSATSCDTPGHCARASSVVMPSSSR